MGGGVTLRGCTANATHASSCGPWTNLLRAAQSSTVAHTHHTTLACIKIVELCIALHAEREG